MRITQSMQYESFLQNLQLTQERAFKAQQQVSSGKKVATPSDDPVATTDILRLHGESNEDDQYSQNLTFAKSKLQLTDGVLDSIEQIVERARTLAQSSFSSPTTTATSAYSTEVTSLRDQLVTAANTTFAGRYIFGGTVTTQPPYVKNPDSSVTYNGNSQGMPIQISRSATVETQVPGSDLFSGSVNVFDVLADLATAIDAGDHDGINTQIQKLEQVTDVISVARTKVGSALNLTTNTESDLSAAKLSRDTQLSTKEAADLAAAISELTASQNSMQATLAVGAKISQLSLLDYLK
jgi:flagellar hook-associated protein 3 FlgL